VSFPILVLGNSGSATPTGSVTITSDGATLGSVKLSGGKATFSTKKLAAGQDSIVANYGGDKNFASSSSPAFKVNVSAAK
jgi:hypothetical protein